MERRKFLAGSAAGLGMAGLYTCVGSAGSAGGSLRTLKGEDVVRLNPPGAGKIPVAFVISKGATVIDFAGPWEVFQDVHVSDRGSSMVDQMPFELYTVSDSRQPVRCTGGAHSDSRFHFRRCAQASSLAGGRSQFDAQGRRR